MPLAWCDLGHAWSWNLYSRSRLKEDCSTYFHRLGENRHARKPLRILASAPRCYRNWRCTKKFCWHSPFTLGVFSRAFQEYWPFDVHGDFILYTGPSTSSLETHVSTQRKIIIKVRPFRLVFRTVLLYVVAAGWKGKSREVVPSSKKQRRRGMLLLEDDGWLMMEQWVSIFFNFHCSLGKIHVLTHIFEL